MNIELSTHSPRRTRNPRTALRAARFEDYEQIVRLESTLHPVTLPFDEWRAIWVENPLWPRLRDSWPIGWVLESASGEIVGCMGNIPLEYHFRGEQLMVASGRAWVISPTHRAFGSAVRLLKEHFGQPTVDLVLDTSVSAEAVERCGHLSNKIPAGDWESVAFFITNHRAVAARVLKKMKVPLAGVLSPPAAIGLRLKDAVFAKQFARHPQFDIEEAAGFDSRFDDFWAELLQQKSQIVLSARDSATMSWHYASPLRKKRLWIYTASRNGKIRAYAIFERKDFGDELHRMRLVDFQTIEDVDLLSDILAIALRRCVAEGVCVLDKSGIGLASMRIFDESTPYRRKQPWPFWYRTTNPSLVQDLRNPDHWEPTEYDGDVSLV